jgi:hypothetical protein
MLPFFRVCVVALPYRQPGAVGAGKAARNDGSVDSNPNGAYWRPQGVLATGDRFGATANQKIVDAFGKGFVSPLDFIAVRVFVGFHLAGPCCLRMKLVWVSILKKSHETFFALLSD